MIAATVEELDADRWHQAGVPGAGRRASHDLSSSTAARAPASAAGTGTGRGAVRA